MEIIKFEKYGFRYAQESEWALKNIDLKINEGEILLLFGASGSGKTTLLNSIKREISPIGEHRGKLLYENMDIEDISAEKSSVDIGMVFQIPESQIVTETVFQEIVFGMENMGFSQELMKRRLGEIITFFGFRDMMDKKIEELSGGQKQLLNLASILALGPKILILDEPTSQLDPVAARDFLSILAKINEEFSTTIIITEHRLEEVVSISHRMAYLEDGEVRNIGSPKDIVKYIWENSSMKNRDYIPSVSRMFLNLKSQETPLNVREGKQHLNREGWNLKRVELNSSGKDSEEIVSCKNIRYMYNKRGKEILKGVDFSIKKGEIVSIMGGNGEGKSTFLKILAGIIAPLEGEYFIDKKKKKKLEEIRNEVSYLPQNPRIYFAGDTIGEEFDFLKGKGVPKEKIASVIDDMKISEILSRHPYDVSGGELQRAALSCVFAVEPKLLLLDEPTKGMDPIFKNEFGMILKKLSNRGISIVIASHDMEFSAEYSDTCVMMSAGELSKRETPESFFYTNYFYTTTIGRMLREKLPGALLWKEVTC